MKRLFLLFTQCVFVMFCSVVVQAEPVIMQSKPMPREPRMVVFPFDANAIFRVYTEYGFYTHFQFSEDESIIALVVSDDTQWQHSVLKTQRDIFIRPLEPNITGAATVITNLRRYQIELLDANTHAKDRNHRVTWLSAGGVYEQIASQNPSKQKADDPSVNKTNQTPALFDLSQLNFDYTITGDQGIAPTRVFDDGTHAWLAFDRPNQQIPAVFLVNAKGEGALVNFSAIGNYLKLDALIEHGAVLKLGSQVVKIHNKKSECGFFDDRCKSLTMINQND